MTENISYEAYCFKCKTKRVLQNPQAVFLANGTPALRGVCPECGAVLTRIGKTPAHEGLQVPEIVRDTVKKAPARAVALVTSQTVATAPGVDGEAYCAKCRTKRPIRNPVATFAANGTPITRGVCPECGTVLT